MASDKKFDPTVPAENGDMLSRDGKRVVFDFSEAPYSQHSKETVEAFKARFGREKVVAIPGFRDMTLSQLEAALAVANATPGPKPQA